jgi:hypothetical protein
VKHKQSADRADRDILHPISNSARRINPLCTPAASFPGDLKLKFNLRQN